MPVAVTAILTLVLSLSITTGLTKYLEKKHPNEVYEFGPGYWILCLAVSLAFAILGGIFAFAFTN